MKKYTDSATLEHDKKIKGVHLVQSWIKDGQFDCKYLDKVIKIFEQYINHDEQESILIIKIADIINSDNNKFSLENKIIATILLCFCYSSHVYANIAKSQIVSTKI